MGCYFLHRRRRLSAFGVREGLMDIIGYVLVPHPVPCLCLSFCNTYIYALLL